MDSLWWGNDDGAVEDEPASGGGSRTGAVGDELEGCWSLIMVMLKW